MSDGRRGARASRWMGNIAWIVMGFVLYWVCTDMFGGYPQVHSEVLSWIAVTLIVVLGAITWYRHRDVDDH